MKIAVLSDIHSNLLALNLAINSLKEENVDDIFFLGDYVTDGEYGNEVLNIVKKMSNYVIRGNREEYILNYSPERKDFINYKSIYTTYNSLTEDNLKYIKSLPEYFILEINNHRVLMLHSDNYYNIADDYDKIFDMIIEDFDFDICFFGHTHEYVYKEYKNRIFINPGSVGEPTDSPTYKYCIVEINDKVSVTLKEFETKETFLELVRNYKETKYYKDNYFWANFILYTIRDGIDYCALFFELFNPKIKDTDRENAEIFNKIWEETYQDFRKKYNLDVL